MVIKIKKRAHIEIKLIIQYTNICSNDLNDIRANKAMEKFVFHKILNKYPRNTVGIVCLFAFLFTNRQFSWECFKN